MRKNLRAPRNRFGQALVEYALVVALVGTGLTFALASIRNSIGNTTAGASNRIGQTAGCSYGVACAVTTPTDPGGSGGNGGGNGNNGGGSGNNGNGNNGNGNGNGNGNNGNGNGNGGGNGSNGNGNGNGGGKK